jgi:hypothetical protein
MGHSSYSYSNAENSRSVRGTLTNTVAQNFTQTVEKKVHESMKSQGITLRESRDSEAHPNSFPIIIGLDLTGSMQQIPQNLIQTGLPKMISSIIQGGIQSPSVLFLGIGDHEADKYPLQVAQFESGDVELDLWLSRTYLEGGGGGNEGESYSLAHFFAANYCKTDSFEKRKVKGVLVTIGDEPNLSSYPARVLNEIMGTTQSRAYTANELLEAAQKEWEVFHINPRGGSADNAWRNPKKYWQPFLGQNYIETPDYTLIPSIISELVVKVGKAAIVNEESSSKNEANPSDVSSGDSDRPTFL